MANAGASLVQIYTTFGYRGVGTPRLLKDEISASLSGLGRGSSWSSQIGKDWGKGMGWDENLLKKESERVKKEAAGLGELLRSLKKENKSDLKDLIREAERALGKAPHPQAQTKEGGKGEARDNLMGAGHVADNNAEVERDTARGLVEDTMSPQVVEGASASLGRIEASTIARGGIEGMQRAGEAVGSLLEELGADRAADMGPVVVPVQAEAEEKEEDPWTRNVRSGQRRLV